MSGSTAELIAPVWDSRFPQHNIHGADRQRELIEDAVRFCRRKRLAIDVGAHIGLCSIVLGEKFRGVRAFEPVDENWKCLIRNVPHNVLPLKAALSSEAHGYSMELPEGGNSGCWHFGPGSTATFTLDSFDYEDVDFIKLDVEGAEGFVLQGAVDTLQAYKPVVLFEDNSLGGMYFEEDWVNPKTVLEELGYKPKARIHKNEVWAC